MRKRADLFRILHIIYLKNFRQFFTNSFEKDCILYNFIFEKKKIFYFFFLSKIMILQAFVYHNDIYYSGGPDNNHIHRITRDNNTLVYNGITDWIYEEEIFNSNVVSKYTTQFDAKSISNAIFRYNIIIVHINMKFL